MVMVLPLVAHLQEAVHDPTLDSHLNSRLGLTADRLMTGGPPRSVAPLRRTGFPHRPYERLR